MNTLPEPNASLQITRILPAPPARVYAAWTDPVIARQWWGPANVQTLALELDARVGGAWSWRLIDDEGDEVTAFGEFRELHPPEKIVFSWQWAGEERWKDRESIVTIRLLPHPEGTEQHFHHDALPGEKSRDAHRGGWEGMMAKLQAFLQTSP